MSLIATLAIAAAALAVTPAVASTPTTAAELAPPSSFDVGDRPGTSRAAFEERVATILTQRLGDAFTDARYRWIRCPQAGRRYAREWGDNYVACQAEIGDDRERRAMHIDFRYREPGWSPTPEPMTYLYHQDGQFVRAPRACARRTYERLARRAGYRIVAFHSDGGWEGCDPATAMLTRVIARRLEGPSSFVLWADQGFIDRAFPQRSRFVCRRTGTRRTTVRCRNELGHGWTVQLRRSPAR
ncbi:MAG: hypothetical protein WC558_10160 [Patulibacter sp.]